MGIQIGASGRGLTNLELFGVVNRACSKCSEPNPAYVYCGRCNAKNFSGQNCRECGNAIMPNDPWLDNCPNCGTPAVIHDLGKLTAWYRNPIKQIKQMFVERFFTPNRPITPSTDPTI